MFNPSLSRLLDTLDQRIIFVIESQSPGTINNPSLDMSSKVHLYNIIIFQNRVVPTIWRPMSCNMVPAATGRVEQVRLHAARYQKQ